MTGTADPTVVSGQGRNLATGPANVPVSFELRTDDFTLALAGQQPLTAAYRDLSTLAVDQGRVLLGVAGGARFIAEQLGASLGTLIGELRERRARQMLTDRLVDLPEGERLELFEYEASDEHGVAQLAFHPWGFALMPLDERRAWRLVRRADIASVAPDQSRGRVRIETAARPGRAGLAFDLLGLGLDTVRTAQRFADLRQTALTDAAAIVAGLLAGAPAQTRERASLALIDGRPANSTELGAAWPEVERAVLTEPTFAATYAALAARSESASGGAPRWIALAPVRPTDPTQHMAWFLVGLPGGLLGLELVSAGSHATYLFRATDSYDAAAFDVSECLIDTRFLRSAIYMTDAQLLDARNVRQRLAVAALPSLQAARQRFVGRLIHADEEAWATSLDEAIKWNANNGSDAARWPGSDQSEGD